MSGGGTQGPRRDRVWGACNMFSLKKKDRSMEGDIGGSPAILSVVGLPESGRLKVQRREGVTTALSDVYGLPEALYTSSAPPGTTVHACFGLRGWLRASCTLSSLTTARINGWSIRASTFCGPAIVRPKAFRGWPS